MLSNSLIRAIFSIEGYVSLPGVHLFSWLFGRPYGTFSFDSRRLRLRISIIDFPCTGVCEHVSSSLRTRFCSRLQTHLAVSSLYTGIVENLMDRMFQITQEIPIPTAAIVSGRAAENFIESCTNLVPLSGRDHPRRKIRHQQLLSLIKRSTH